MNKWQNFISIMKSLNAEMWCVQAPDSAAESQLMTKTCCFLLVDIMYSCLSKDEVHSKNSRINSVYCKQKPDLAGNEMTKMLTKLVKSWLYRIDLNYKPQSVKKNSHKLQWFFWNFGITSDSLLADCLWVPIGWLSLSPFWLIASQYLLTDYLPISSF